MLSPPHNRLSGRHPAPGPTPSPARPVVTTRRRVAGCRASGGQASPRGGTGSRFLVIVVISCHAIVAHGAALQDQAHVLVSPRVIRHGRGVLVIVVIVVTRFARVCLACGCATQEARDEVGTPSAFRPFAQFALPGLPQSQERPGLTSPRHIRPSGCKPPPVRPAKSIIAAAPAAGRPRDDVRMLRSTQAVLREIRASVPVRKVRRPHGNGQESCAERAGYFADSNNCNF